MSAPNFAASGWKNGWYVVPWEVTWRDLDAIGHVNNAVYFTYFEWARTRYWFDLNGGSTPGELGFIVAHARCDFRLQLELTEKIEIGTRIAEVRTSSFDFMYEIRNAADDLAATGTVVVVLYSWEKKQKIRIGAELRRKIDAFQGEGGK